MKKERPEETPGQSGWLGAAAVCSIPLSLFLSFFNVYILFSFFNVYIYLFTLFVQLPFSSLSCAGSILAVSVCLFFPFFLLLPTTPNRPCQSERGSKARHEADSFESAEWSERLTPGQSGWLGAAAVGSIPALALSVFLQRLYSLLFQGSSTKSPNDITRPQCCLPNPRSDIYRSQDESINVQIRPNPNFEVRAEIFQSPVDYSRTYF